ncbi:uncharacterized protein PG986_008062, partial [Apiospora aurea]
TSTFPTIFTRLTERRGEQKQPIAILELEKVFWGRGQARRRVEPPPPPFGILKGEWKSQASPPVDQLLEGCLSSIFLHPIRRWMSKFPV